MKSRYLGYTFALASAALVGLFTVLNKWLLVEEVPALTAGTWTYFAAGLALMPWALRYRGLKFKRPFVILCWLLAGSVLGPSLYFIGLMLTTGVEGVLLINTEAVFTALLAFVFFKERLSRKTMIASIIVIASAIWMSWSGGSLISSNALGNLLIALGYLGWAIENNFGRLLGEDIPAVTLVCFKALAAGAVMGILAFCFRQPLSVSWHVVPGIVASGALSLGLSLALFYLAMRHIGAARTGLISSTSTLWGIIGTVWIIGESLSQKVIIGGILMMMGVAIFAMDSEEK
ncbi:DMT family transporter [Gorillibacterium massiliense]|uniref:DMT family transporter n=1 Tax=Gorillibacterium massiliense TaxID=1280390 RepID=UPI0004B3551C|nr:DMT family transporter [Gorillibacterium massiliense]